MAAVGQTSTLPGSRNHPIPEGQTCDFCVKLATKRVQGETDSFGAEFIDVCDRHLEQVTGRPTYSCQKCRERKECVPRRDYDEGLYGPVYWYCTDCAAEHDAEVRCYLEDEPDDYGFAGYW